MKLIKNAIFLSLLALPMQYSYAQDYAGINAKLDKMIEERNIDKTPVNTSLVNKKFIIFKESQNQIVKQIIEFKENNLFNLIELYENKTDSSKSSVLYSGDILRRDNIISARADKKEQKLIALPETYNFMLQKRDGILFLINVNNNDKWIDTDSVQNKAL